MAEPIPNALKVPEIRRFINRANQLRRAKPAIAYWCEYHAVNQIVGKGLHNSDEEAFAFTKVLLENLEAAKAERPDDDAITDNDVGRAYVDQFANEVFSRAERTMEANKVTRQTADTFDAAATFFDLGHVWGQPEPDIVQKIKFCKWNAARILKAIQEGKDPNESNPKLKEPEPFVDAPLDSSDPEVQLIAGPSAPQPASVDQMSNTQEPPGTAQSNATQGGYFPPPAPGPFQPSVASGPPPLASPQSSGQIPLQPSPTIPTKLPATFTPSPMQNEPQWSAPPPIQKPSPIMPPHAAGPSVSGHQSPGIPSAFSSSPSLMKSPHGLNRPPSQQQDMYGSPPASNFASPSPQHPPPPPKPSIPWQQMHQPQPPSQPPSQFSPQPHQFQTPTSLPQSQFPLPMRQGPPYNQSADQYSAPAYQAPNQHAPPPPVAQNHGPAANFAPSLHQKDINQAQKHAKWAISALNFEDVPTAIQELRNALAQLGAQ